MHMLPALRMGAVFLLLFCVKIESGRGIPRAPCRVEGALKIREVFMEQKKRIGVIGIVVRGDRSVAVEIQNLLSQYGDNILGRMGIPNRSSNIYVISIIFEGTNEEFSALTGKLGRLENVNVKSAITSVEI